METKEEKKRRVLHILKFFFFDKKSDAVEWQALYPFHDSSLYLPAKEKWTDYSNVMKNLLRKNPTYMYVPEVQQAKTIDQLIRFERDHARNYYHNVQEQKLLNNRTWKYIEGILSYSYFQASDKQVIIFGEQHAPLRCIEKKSTKNLTVPYIHVLHHLLTTEASAEHPIDVFIEQDRSPQTIKQPAKTIPIDDIFLRPITHYRYPLQQILALYGRHVLPHVRFHWVDIRNFPFLNQMLHVKKFLKGDDREPDVFAAFLRTYIQPLINANGQFLEGLFVQVGIRKQLNKITNVNMRDYITHYFKYHIISLAMELIEMHPVRMWKKLLRMKSVEKQRELVQEMYEGDLLEYDQAFLKRDSPVRLFRSMLMNYVHRLNAYFMDVYLIARLYKPYVHRAVIHVGDVHAETYRNFFNSLPNMEMLDDYASETGCLRVPFAPSFFWGLT